MIDHTLATTPVSTGKTTEPVLTLKGARQVFKTPRGEVPAVAGVDLDPGVIDLSGEADAWSGTCRGS